MPKAKRPTARLWPRLILLLLLLAGGWLGLKWFYPSLTAEQLLYLAQSQFQFSNRQVLGPVIPLTRGGDGLEPDLLALTMAIGSGTERYRATYLSQVAGLRRVRWEVELGQDSASASHFAAAADGETVYLMRNNSLLGVDRTSGTIKWETALSDQLPPQCQSCLLTLGDHIVVFTVDRTLHGVQRVDGRAAWQVRLQAGRASTFDLVVTAAGQLAVLDELPEAEFRPATGLYLFDPQTGREVQRLVPRCGEPNGRQAGLNLYAPLFFNETRETVAFVFAGPSFELCLQQWDLASGRPIFEHRLSETALDNSSLARLADRLEGKLAAVTASDRLILPGGERLLVADLAAGQITTLLEAPDYALSPLVNSGGSLIVLAERMRGSTAHELWGLDPASGEQLWRHPLPSRDFFRPGGLAGRGDWAWHLTRPGVVILHLSEVGETAFQDRYRVHYELLAPETGQRLAQVDSQAEDGFWTGLVWGNDFAYLTLRDLYRVELATGQTRPVWPPRLPWPEGTAP